MNQAKGQSKGFKKVLCFCMSLVLVLPLLGVTVLAGDAYSYTTTTHTYVSDCGLFRFEIPGYIGMVNIPNVPEVVGYGYTRNVRTDIEGFHNTFHVIIVEENQLVKSSGTFSNTFDSPIRVYPAKNRYIFGMRWGDRRHISPMAAIGWGYSNSHTNFSEYYTMPINSAPSVDSHDVVSMNFIYFAVTDENMPFADFGWRLSPVNGRGLLDASAYIIDDGMKNMQIKGEEVYNYIFNTLLLTPSMADTFLETGIIQLGAYLWKDYDEHSKSRDNLSDFLVTRNLSVPGLRDLLLAARGEAATAVTPAAPAPAPPCRSLPPLPRSTFASTSARPPTSTTVSTVPCLLLL
jgi:hypothetical protein